MNKTDATKMKKYALAGIVGGLLFAIGDLLVYLLPHYMSPKLYNDLVQMSMWRLACSLYLGCVGCGMLLVGFHSLYRIVGSSGSNITKYLLIVIGFGIVLTPLGHFLIACISHMTYKLAVESGLSAELAKTLSGGWNQYINPVKNVVMFIVIFLQSVVYIVLILSRKINAPKWTVICNPLAMVLVSIPLVLLLSGTRYAGVTECFESLGEGLAYIPVYIHWNNKSINSAST